MTHLSLAVPDETEPGTYSSTLYIMTVDADAEASPATSNGLGFFQESAVGATIEIPITVTIVSEPPVPEPAGLGLIGLGLLAARKKRK